MKSCRRFAFGLVSIVLMSLAVAGCQGDSRLAIGELTAPRRATVRFESETSVRTDTYELEAEDARVEFCVRIALVAGSVRWNVADSMEQSLSGAGEATHRDPYKAHQCFEITPGTWQFEIDMVDATGEYEVAWREIGLNADTSDYLLGLEER